MSVSHALYVLHHSCVCGPSQLCVSHHNCVFASSPLCICASTTYYDCPCILTAASMYTRKLDRGLCLSRTKNRADYDSRGFEPAIYVLCTTSVSVCLHILLCLYVIKSLSVCHCISTPSPDIFWPLTTLQMT